MLSTRFLGLYTAFALLAASITLSLTAHISWGWPACALAFCLLGVHDVFQTRHSILRNYPLLGHLRFMLEAIRPEIRQYFVESNTDKTPFSRNQRSLVYQRAKDAGGDLKAFGTEQDVNAAGHEWVSHSLVPGSVASNDFRVVVGAHRAKPYSMSAMNVSAMSYGALSANAIRALNLGAKTGGFAHNTGEAAISPYHREHGGDLIWQISSGFFGCRNPDGTLNPAAFASTAADPQVKMIEVKLSQGAKPTHGGALAAAKVTEEIASILGVAMGHDCVYPAAHPLCRTPRELLQFIETLRTLSGGKPTGFKLCIGQPWEFFSITKAMLETGIVPDFIVVDGAEGGTAAAPVEFADHVGMPLQEGLRLVHNTLVGIGLRDQVRLGASGKLISAFDIARAMALGADWVNSARGFLFAVGCIQAQVCNTGRCPTGVASRDPGRRRGLVVPDKATRVANFHRNTLHALAELVEAAGLASPSQLKPRHIMRRISAFDVRPLSALVETVAPGELLHRTPTAPTFAQWWSVARAESFALADLEDEPVAARKATVMWCRVEHTDQASRN